MSVLELDGQVVVDERGRPVRDPADIEQDADYIRTHLAPKPEANQLKTPDDIIHELDWAKHLSAKSAVIIRDADRALRALQRRYSKAELQVTKKSTAKSIDERKAEAREQLEDLFQELENADVVFEYAKRVAKSVEGSLSALQTQARQVDAMYRMAGTGRQEA